MEAAEALWPASPDDLREQKLPRKCPRPHQLEAIEDIAKGFDTADRGQLLMACGTGKTLTALYVHERLSAARTLVLVPSLSLLAQTIREWTANSAQGFDFIAVCSDDTVAEADSVTSNTSDLGIPVTTDPEVIANALRSQLHSIVVISTYHSSPHVASAMRLSDVPQFDLVIADEAHRCAGVTSPSFGTVLDDRAIRAKRRLYMTATPRVMSSGKANAANSADLDVSSMDDGAKFGAVLHRLSFGEAISRKLLTDYRVVVVAVDDESYRDWAQRGQFVALDGEQITDARALASHIGVAKSMLRYDLHRTISFHSRVSRARDFALELPRVVEWMPPNERPQGAVLADFVSGEMPAGLRRTRLNQLAAAGGDEHALLSNARCLAEGVDVPSLDGVAFIDPRGSEVDIVQAVGRAIRLSGVKSVGTIIIPVFVEAGADPASALRDSSFKQVWNVVRALRAHDEELGHYLDELRYELGRGRGSSARPGKIVLDVPKSITPDFATAFDVSMVEFATASWDFWLGLLDRFCDETGHCCPTVAYRVDGYALGEWVNTQRDRRLRGTLSAEREERLAKRPGWSWDPNADRWEEGFRHLLAYVQEHGHAAVPPRFIFNDYRLGQWAMVQRNAQARSSLDANRSSRLEAVPGWSFDPRGDKWERGFQQLTRYVELNGDARVPRSCIIDGYNLGAWVKTQRRAYAADRLAVSRRERLEQFNGWTWRAIGNEWDEGFERLREYIAACGDALVPASYVVDGYRLGGWVNAQRHARAKRNLEPDRERRLNELPEWQWSGRNASWDEGFDHLMEYVKTHGEALVPTGHEESGYPLGQWVATQRQFYAQGNLTADRAQRLESAAGWAWNARGTQWEANFHRLVDFIADNGHALVPKRSLIGGYRLGAWVALQRRYYSKEELEVERVSRLNALPEWKWKAR